jgi:nucleotide-binding universal stress UspA family protein
MFQVKRILYPINLDSKNISTISKALEIAQLFKSEIHILYVNDPAAGYRFPTDREDAVSLRVQEVVPNEVLTSQKIVYAVSKGTLEKEIEKYCKDNGIDMIITGHKHRNKLYSSLFDSPDVNIIDAMKIPILVIPKK